MYGLGVWGRVTFWSLTGNEVIKDVKDGRKGVMVGSSNEESVL